WHHVSTLPRAGDTRSGGCTTRPRCVLVHLVLWYSIGMQLSAYAKPVGVSTRRAARLRRAGRRTPPAPWPVVQDVLTRLDRTYPACVRRASRAGERPGSPRVHGADRANRVPDTPVGTGATRDQGFLARSQLGRRAVRPLAPQRGDTQDR